MNVLKNNKNKQMQCESIGTYRYKFSTNEDVAKRKAIFMASAKQGELEMISASMHSDLEMLQNEIKTDKEILKTKREKFKMLQDILQQNICHAYKINGADKMKEFYPSSTQNEACRYLEDSLCDFNNMFSFFDIGNLDCD